MPSFETAVKRSGSISSRPVVKSRPTVGELFLARVQLGEVRRRRAGSDDLAVASVEASEDDVAAVHELRLAAVGRDSVDVDVAAVLDREHDRVTVPDRLA